MDQLCIAALLLFSVAGWIVGVRLWRLARQTGEVPERAMAVLMFGIGGFGYPCMLLSRLFEVGSLGYGLTTGLAVLSINAGITAAFVFTWKVFHPDALWAKRVSWAAGVLLVFIGLSAAVSATLNGGAGDPGPEGRLFILLNFALSMAAFLWSGGESIRYARMLDRRAAIGLGNPVVANRFWLWGCQGMSTTVINLSNIVVVLLGGDISTHPLVLSVTGVLGTLNAGFLFFAFMPPDRYRRWIAGEPTAPAA